MSWTNDEHRRAVTAAQDGLRKLTNREVEYLKQAARQAGERGREAQKALENRLR